MPNNRSDVPCGVLFLLALLALALFLAFLLWAAPQPRIIAAQEAPYALQLAFIPASQGNAAGWVYVEAPGAITLACTGCALGSPADQVSARGLVRTVPLRALWPGWQVTTTTTDGGSVTLTRGTVLWFPIGGR